MHLDQKVLIISLLWHFCRSILIRNAISLPDSNEGLMRHLSI